MASYRPTRGADGVLRLKVTARGAEVMRDPLLNKGSAFTDIERRTLGLDGLLPTQQNTIEQQAQRIYRAIAALPEPLQQYTEISQLQDRNENLFYRVLIDHLETLMPIIYTPTVGLATRRFSHVFRRPRGVWVTPAHKGRIEQVLRNAGQGREIRLMVVTDNEAILGIGDQGAGGMAISIGKLALYTAGAGIDPAQTLPVSLDVGTDNDDMLKDELYLGWPQRRLRGAAYDALIEEFVTAARTVFPGALVQWEDFRKDNALSILDRYRNVVPSFNDDIQGTGAVALAGVLGAGRVSGVKPAQQRVLIYGAGAAGLGIARQLRAGLSSLGVAGDDLAGAVGVMDTRGLLVADRAIADSYKLELAWSPATAARFNLGEGADRALLNVVRNYRPTVLIGSSGQGGAFNEQVIREMARHATRPVVMPFSNPTDNCEAVPKDVVAWTDGRALIATGSPFPAVVHDGREIHIGQGNNAFIFPGLGLGALIAGARAVTDGMIAAAANALATQLTASELAQGYLFPPIARLREVSHVIARAVIETSVREGSAGLNDASDMDRLIAEATWTPDYPVLEAV